MRLFADMEIQEDLLRDRQAQTLIEASCAPRIGRSLRVAGKLMSPMVAAVYGRELNASGQDPDRLTRTLQALQAAPVVSAMDAREPGALLGLLSQLCRYNNNLLIIDRYLKYFTSDWKGCRFKRTPFFQALVETFEKCADSAIYDPTREIAISIHNLIDPTDLKEPKYLLPPGVRLTKQPNEIVPPDAGHPVLDDFQSLKDLIIADGPRRHYRFNLYTHTNSRDFHSRVCMTLSPRIGFGLSTSLPWHVGYIQGANEAFFCPEEILNRYQKLGLPKVVPTRTFTI